MYEVEGCPWGDGFGARLNKKGASIPGFDQSGGSEDSLANAERARWALLAQDPLFELKLLPEEPTFGEVPGVRMWANIPPLAGNPSLLRLADSWDARELWMECIEWVQEDEEWRGTITSITLQVPAASESVARAIVAAFQFHLWSGGYAGLTGEERDRLQSTLLEPLGGPPLGIRDWLLGRVTAYARQRRGGISDRTSPIFGDILRYQSRGEAIRNFIEYRAQQVSPTVILAHSLGGVAAVDWLALGRRPITHLITVGSQAPYFYEIDALVSRPYGAGLPDHFPRKWLNVFDMNDFLSYKAEDIFPNHVVDKCVDNGQPFPESHGAYWNNEAEVWPAIKEFLL